jgi:hypothetical protein
MGIREACEVRLLESASESLGGGIPGVSASPSSTVWFELTSDGGSGGFKRPARRVCRTLEMERPGTYGSLRGQRTSSRFWGR